VLHDPQQIGAGMGIVIDKHVTVTMRDGTELSADVYRPDTRRAARLEHIDRPVGSASRSRGDACFAASR
jgi:predicted acyl esterase